MSSPNIATFLESGNNKRGHCGEIKPYRYSPSQFSNARCILSNTHAPYQGLYLRNEHNGNLDRTLTGDSYKVASHKSSITSKCLPLPFNSARAIKMFTTTFTDIYCRDYSKLRCTAALFPELKTIP
jgi:hypothetical protein